MSLMDNVIVAGALTMRSKRQIVEKSRELFALVHIDTETQKRTSAQVSGGEAQRASIVRALIDDPELVFADEPTGALNSRHAKAVLDVFSMLHARGQSIVMVTHDRHSALRANRVLYCAMASSPENVCLAHGPLAHTTAESTNLPSSSKRWDGDHTCVLLPCISGEGPKGRSSVSALPY